MAAGIYSTVDEFLADLPEPQASEVRLLRQLLLETNDELQERIASDVPTYSLRGEDRVAITTDSTKHICLVLRSGAAIDEAPSAGNEMGSAASDVHARITFGSIEDIQAKSPALLLVLTKWLEVLE